MLEDVEGIERRSLADPDLVDFSVGTPPYCLLRRALLRAGADAVLDASADAAGVPATFLQYGAGYGSLRFRQALAAWLAAEYAAQQPPPERVDGGVWPPVVRADELLVTNGASQGLSLVCRVCARPGDVVLVEEATYFLALRVFASYGLRCVPVALDPATGIDVADLEAKLRAHAPKLLYTIPTFQNPTGATVPLAARHELVRLCQQHGCVVVADEVYQLLPFEPQDAPPTPLWALCGAETGVVSLQSFSKLLAPGLRLGWIQSRDRALLAALEGDGVVASGGGLNPFAAEVVRPLLLPREDGHKPALLSEHVQQLRAAYKARAEALYGAVERWLPQARTTRPRGGFFAWLTLPTRWSKEARQRALAEGRVAVREGSECAVADSAWLPSDTTARSLRLCFAHYAPEQLACGVERLARFV